MSEYRNIPLSCLRPRTVINKYTGERFTVGCGTCKACLQKLANKAAYQCSLHEADYNYCMFVTLTYSNDNVPLLHIQYQNTSCAFDVDYKSTETRIKEYYDFFFVPYRQLWRFSDQFLTGMTDMNPEFSNSITDSARISASRTPYFKVNELLGYLNTTLNGGKVHPDINNNRFGFDRSALTYKLLKYLGYGFLDGKGTLTPTHYGFSGNLQQFNDVTAMNYLGINAFPVLAYQKICQDYFRNTQWENRNPTLYNVDYLNGNDTHIPLPALAMGTSVPRNMLDLN